MLVIERDANLWEYEYSISGYDLIITLKNPVAGAYYVFLSGYDLLNNKYLKSTTGNMQSTYGFEFVVTNEYASGGDDNNTNTTEPRQIVVLDAQPVTVNYNKLMYSPQFVQTFSSQIAKPFKVSVIVDRIDGEASYFEYTVSDVSETAFYSQNQFMYVMPQFVPNQIVYINTDEIEFENGHKGSFEFTVLTQLKPYINVRQIQSQLGKYAKEITDADIYYASLKQMIAYESNSGNQIIGKSIANQKIRMFLEQYQYLELLMLLINRKVIASGNTINVGVANVSIGNVTDSHLDFIKRQQEQLISEMISNLSPISQNKSANVVMPINTKAMYQLKVFEEIFGFGGEI